MKGVKKHLMKAYFKKTFVNFKYEPIIILTVIAWFARFLKQRKSARMFDVCVVGYGKE